MASTTFTDLQTIIYASWLNDVNVATYTTVPAHTASLAALTSTGSAVVATSLNGGQLAGMRNKINNGDMRIDQRNGGVAATVLFNTFPYVLDRWLVANGRTNGTTLSVQADTSDVPPGFSHAMKTTNTTAGASAAGDVIALQHVIEGLNIADLDWGKATAKPITLSFWAKSTIAGTYAVSARNGATNRSYVAHYTLPANTWTYVSLTITGETSGVWNINTAAGITLNWDLGMGSTFNTATIGSWISGSNVFGSTTSVKLSNTAGAIFRLSGVQVEVGTVATPYEWRSYTQELFLCQRYYQVVKGGMGGYTGAGTSLFTQGLFSPIMRATPSVVVSAQTNTNTTAANMSALDSATWQFSATGSALSGFIASATGAYSADI